MFQSLTFGFVSSLYQVIIATVLILTLLFISAQTNERMYIFKIGWIKVFISLHILLRAFIFSHIVYVVSDVGQVLCLFCLELRINTSQCRLLKQANL